MKTIDEMTDDELSNEIHRRRTERRDKLHQNYINFGKQFIVILEDYEKMSGNKIERSAYGNYSIVQKVIK